jgi:lysyl-tRNA synthetase class 1
MLKRFVGARAVSVLDIPGYMNELDELEDIHFGKRKIADKKEYIKLSGLYKYCWWLKPPDQPGVHVPYNLLVYLARVAPKGSEENYIIGKLTEYNYLKQKELTPDLRQRIQYALNWAQDFKEVKEAKVQLSDQQKAAIQELARGLLIDLDAEQIQGIIFNSARKHGIEPREFFKTLYTILLGTQAGPRLGPYILDVGKQSVVQTLERALEK